MVVILAVLQFYACRNIACANNILVYIGLADSLMI
jgi:hypothetical protein